MGVIDQVGTVSPGKVADLILVRQNPLVSIETLRDVTMVMQRGRKVR